MYSKHSKACAVNPFLKVQPAVMSPLAAAMAQHAVKCADHTRHERAAAKDTQERWMVLQCCGLHVVR